MEPRPFTAPPISDNGPGRPISASRVDSLTAPFQSPDLASFSAGEPISGVKDSPGVPPAYMDEPAFSKSPAAAPKAVAPLESAPGIPGRCGCSDLSVAGLG